MSEHPDSPLTDTALGVSAADDTQFIPDASRNVSTPLAWEQAGDGDDIENYPPTGHEQPFGPRSEPQSWGWAWVLVTVVLVAAVIIVLLVWVVGTHHPTERYSWRQPTTPVVATQPPAPVSPTDTASLPPVPDGGREVPPSPDDQFIDALATHGWDRAGRDAEIRAGHEICARLVAGAYQADVVSALLAGTPWLTRFDAEYEIDTSIKYFCPEVK